MQTQNAAMNGGHCEGMAVLGARARSRLLLGTPLTVKLDGPRLTAPSTSSVTLTAPRCAFSVDGVQLDPGQMDTIAFTGGTQAVSYQTTSTETSTVSLGVTFDGADYLFAVKSTAETGGIEVVLTLDASGGTLKVQAKPAGGTPSNGVRIERHDSTAVVPDDP